MHFRTKQSAVKQSRSIERLKLYGIVIIGHCSEIIIKSMALSKLPVADDASDESVAKGTETPETQQDVANRFTSHI